MYARSFDVRYCDLVTHSGSESVIALFNYDPNERSDCVLQSNSGSGIAGASTGGDLEAACFHQGSGGGIKSPPEDF